MPKGLQRRYGQGDCHFVTFSCYHRIPLRKTVRARNLFVKVPAEVRQGYGFLLVGYVVMPDQVHLLISEPRKGTPSKVVQVLKQRVSRALRENRRQTSGQQLQPLPATTGEEPRRFWQKRFFDFNVWSDAKRKEKLNYMHANPVKKGIVKHAKDWPWSSWAFYHSGESGLVSIDPVD
jgi:putative transposase